MLNWLSERTYNTFIFLFETTLNKLGFFTYEADKEDLMLLANQQGQQLNGLLKCVGFMEQRQTDDNNLLTALVMLSGNEEVTLTSDYLNDIIGKGLSTVFIEEEGKLRLCVVLPEDLDENNNEDFDIIEDLHS